LIARSLTTRLKLGVPVLLTLLAFGSVVSADEPGANPIQKKYITREGTAGVQCRATGLLKELTQDKYKCYGPAGADKCAASLDAVKGKLDPKMLEMFGDLLKTDGAAKPAFLYSAGCKDMNGADFAEYLALGGIGYAKSVAQIDALVALGSPAGLAGLGGEARAQVVASLGRFGEPQQAKILPVLKNALAASAKILEFKKNALKLMARFGSDDGVAYSLDVLKQGTDKDVTKVAAWYLAERKHAAAAPILTQRYEEDKVTFGRALGLLGAKSAVDVLKAEYEKNAGSAVALPATVALLNLGDKSYDYAADLVAMIQGKRPLSIKDRAKKAEELAAKKKGADERWQKREDETQEEVARAAAIEATYAIDAASVKKIDEALRATAKKSDWAKASTHAASALGQRGDKAAVADLIKALSSPKKEAREVAINAFGARYDLPEAFLEYVGRKGVVADASVPAALFTYIENESNEAARIQALLAAGAVRSFL
jgi:HEAT repeat protein